MGIKKDKTPYTFKEEVVPLSVKLSKSEREMLRHRIKLGIYRDLHRKNLLTDYEYQTLVENERKRRV